MAELRSALFVDFDNIFTELHRHDRTAAYAFGDAPNDWLARLVRHARDDGDPRRFLQVRAYVNPQGWVEDQVRGDRSDQLYFNRYRDALVRAGFEVIDCVPLSSTMTGSSAVRMVLDIAGVVNRDAPVDEYLIAGSNTDFTPLLHALRAADRRTGIISTGASVSAYRNIADVVLGIDALLELIGCGPEARQSAAASIIVEEMATATKPVRLSTLGQVVRDGVGDSASTTGWFGYGTMRDFIDSLRDEHLATNPGFVWDPARHTPPLDPTAGLTEDDLPAPIAAVRVGADLPLLASHTWPLLFDQVAIYGRQAPRPLTLTECTITVRNQLEDTDPLASRSVVNTVLHRIQNAGLPLDREPPPDAEELQATYKASIVAEYVDAGREMTDGLQRALDRWLSGENGSGPNAG
jgi:hypothetical protein